MMLKIKEILTGVVSQMSRYRGLWLWLWAVSVLSIIDIPGSPEFRLTGWMQVIYVITVGALKGSVVLLTLMLLMRTRLGRLVAWVGVGIYTVMAVVNAFGFKFYGMGISRKLILVIAQTNAFEAGEFMSAIPVNVMSVCMSPSTWIAVFVGVMGAWIVNKLPQKIYVWCVATISLIGGVALGLFAMNFTSGRTAHSLVARTAKYTREVMRSEAEFRAMQRELRPYPFGDSVKSKLLATNVVVIVGESASRSHHSLYGYPLPTTPRLDEMRDSLYVFSDVIGSSAGTAGNMERILTFKTDDLKSGDGLRYPTVIDFFNNAGYYTAWLSNQERTGSVSNTSSVMATMARKTLYIGADNSEDALMSRYDDALLPHFGETLRDTTLGSRLIFMHLLGSHIKYASRYPLSRTRFTADDVLSIKKSLHPWLTRRSAEVVAHYDNSIHFTDSIVAQVFKELGSSRHPSVGIYLSDHGENVYDEGDFTGRGVRYVEVPFIIYANRAYREANPDIMESIARGLHHPISTANLVHSLITLTGTSSPLYTPSLDPLSLHFTPRQRLVDEAPWPNDSKH